MKLDARKIWNKHNGRTPPPKAQRPPPAFDPDDFDSDAEAWATLQADAFERFNRPRLRG